MDSKHFKILSILYYIVSGAIALSLLLGIIEYISLDSRIQSNPVNSGSFSQLESQLAALKSMMLIFSPIAFVLCILTCIAAISWHRKKPNIINWIVAVIGFPLFPVGTALGVYSFYVLLKKKLQK